MFENIAYQNTSKLGKIRKEKKIISANCQTLARFGKKIPDVDVDRYLREACLSVLVTVYRILPI